MSSGVSRVVGATSMGVLTFMLVASAAACAYFFLGFATGILGVPCSSAAAWWERTYPLLPLPLAAAALWAGLRVAGNILRP